MGVPKFYRWISERYPCLSEIVKEYQIPEFDNLYLDMNGIIHICSHPNDDDPHFRISEEDIFKDIFHYIEVLFRMIQPTKVFYMAVDGVAPRAKMNQQRGRRFRSAREAVENEKKAKEKGEVLPEEARFDSNCITPGTEFMTKLDSQLQYFISAKITNDKLWQNCSVIYSGHKTPGEGEHKIMEFIRYFKSRPNYDSNTRHCLYGLDADLIMLGLTSHEPHFSLLREEVRFGGKKNGSKRTPTPEETTFHLLHLSLMREYIEYEFYSLHDSLPFKFDLESVIDDWVFMGFLVGNDFIPHLPGLHINKDALPILYETYIQVMPTLDGYLNEKGSLNLKRFEKFMAKLAEYDIQKFQEFNDNMKYIRCKRGDGGGEEEGFNERMGRLEAFNFDDDNFDENAFGCLDGNALTSEEVRKKLSSLNIQLNEEDDFLEDDDGSLNDEEDAQFEAEFRQHKRHYYMTKMLYEDVTVEILRDQATNYVRGLQWILNYYYNGICSWSWYYPHHYAPYISDIKDFADIDLSFEKAKPFLPFEQLLAVLPPLSVKLLPRPYEKLMLSEDSPLKEFYPKEFSTDLNGKQQDWEAVVLIPFINEEKLIEAMQPCNKRLSHEEKARNSYGPMYVYRYAPDNLGEYKAYDYFLPIGVNHAKVELVWREEWDMHPSDIHKGLLPGVRLDVYFPGFPTLKHIDHTFEVEERAVKVFQQDSRGKNFILKIEQNEDPNLEDLLKNMLGKSVYVNWPHLVEAKVVAISTAYRKYYVKGSDDETINHEEFNPKQTEFYHTLVTDLKNKFMKRWGIDVGSSTQYLVHARLMTGRTYVASHDGRITLEKIWAESEQPFPLQTVVKDIAVHDPGFKQYRTIHEYFEPGTKIFMLGHPYYGCMGEVIEIDPQHKGRIRVSMVFHEDPDIQSVASQYDMLSERYMSTYECSSKLSISSHLFARLTGSIFMAKAQELNPFIDRDSATNKLNIGLNLKSNRRSEEVVGFTKKCMKSNQWLYSQQCVNTLKEYHELFPEVFEYLRNTSKNDIFQDEIFPTNYKERVPELVKWLKDSPFSNAERCKWGSVMLEQSIVQKLSEEVDKTVNQRAKTVKMQVKPHLLFKPNPLQGSTPPDRGVTFNIFDRIINVREGFSVPLGAMGTVIGVQPGEKESDKLYVIFFDKEFPGGLALGGSSFRNRCYRLNSASMLNLSHGKRVNGNHNVLQGVKSGPQANGRPEHLYGTVPPPLDLYGKEPNPTPQRAPLSRNGGGRTNVQVVKSHNVARSSSNQQQEGRKGSNKAEQSTTPFNFTKAATEGKAASYPSPNLKVGAVNGASSFFSGSESPQPPNPNKLPKPMQFRKHLNEHTTDNNQGIKSLQAIPNLSCGNSSNGNNNNNNKGSLVQKVSDVKDVEVVIHGSFYENWPKIKQYGLRKDLRNHIPCVSYVPPKIGSRSYEIHIYLDVGKLLEDGFRILLFQKGQVLCSTQKNGILPPNYFEKVVETKTGRVIFPESVDFPHSPPTFGRGRGRGRGSRGGDGQGEFAGPIWTFENIWSQMGSVEGCTGNQAQSYHGNQSCSSGGEERKKLSVNDLFRFASLHQGSSNSVSVPPVQSQIFSPQFRQPVPPSHNGDKSQFIPTQVERKQTPRKNYPEQRAAPSFVTDAGPPLASNLTTLHRPQPQNSPKKKTGESKNMTQKPPGSDTPSVKPKKKPRSRLAANFGIAASQIRSDNG